MFKDKELENRVSGLESVVQNTGNSIRERLDKIEEQLNPPAFEVGDIVNFFLVDNEFIGEIVEKYYKMSLWEEPKESSKWTIKYLDKNNVLQYVAVEEEDIWVESDDCITDIYDELEELRCQIKDLQNKKK